MAENVPNVFLFYPNLIGYGRIFLAIISCYVMGDRPIVAVFCYALSAVLDAIDGWAARKYNQCSRIGAMLDQLTDRCGTMALCMALCRFYPNSLFWIQMSTIVDISSHWLHLHGTDLTRADTHKKSTNPILHLYYTNRYFLGFMCAGSEAFYLILYVRAFHPGPIIFGIYFLSYIALITFPIALLKSAISLVHLVTAAETVVKYDTNAIITKMHFNDKTR